MQVGSTVTFTEGEIRSCSMQVHVSQAKYNGLKHQDCNQLNKTGNHKHHPNKERLNLIKRLFKAEFTVNHPV